MRAFYIYFVMFILFVLSLNCNSSIEEKKLAKLYVDYLFIVEKYSLDSIALHNEKNKLFKEYGVTEKKFISSFNSMKERRLKWESFFRNVDSALVKKREEINLSKK